MFSNPRRSAQIVSLEESTLDIIIIGGGITGAGIALDAAMKGFRVLLLEKNDFAAGTSSRSTKLIHGGLRYLKQLEFKLVHEVARERRVVYQNARHIVRPEKMLLPIYQGGTLGVATTTMALWLYDLLGGVQKKEKKRMLNKVLIEQTEPLLIKENLLSGGLYFEYRTDDARLTIEVIKTAQTKGAICINYIEAKSFEYDKNGCVNGVDAIDIITGKNIVIKAAVVINAAGPWVDFIRNKDETPKGKKLKLTKGIHLVFPFSKIPIAQALYFDTQDGRMIFAIPRQNITYVGTTDTFYEGEKENPSVSKEDVGYLIDNITKTLNVSVDTGDIVSSWSGLRPLIYEEGKSASELSRKDEIFISKTGLISIAGGKLTGYRKMAEQVMKIVAKRGLSIKTDATTQKQVLIGGQFKSEEDLHNYLEKKIGACKQIEISAEQITNWVYRYGSETDYIIEKMYNFYNEGIRDHNVPILSELMFCIEKESVFTLADFLIRRTGMLYFEREKITNELCQILNTKIGEEHGYSETQNAASLQEFEQAYHQSILFE